MGLLGNTWQASAVVELFMIWLCLSCQTGLRFPSHACPRTENNVCQAPQMGQQLAHVSFVYHWVFPSQPNSFGKCSGKALKSCPVPLITRRRILHRGLAARAKSWHVINITKLATFSQLAHQSNVTHFQGGSYSCFIKTEKNIHWH